MFVFLFFLLILRIFAKSFTIKRMNKNYLKRFSENAFIGAFLGLGVLVLGFLGTYMWVVLSYVFHI